MKKNIICHDCKFARETDGQFNCILLDLVGNPQNDCDHYMPPAGRYDNIETAKDLIREVISHGFSTQQHDRARAQDIFGRESIDNLARLANSEEEISGKYVGSMFYFIAFNIWNWEDATRFYNEHTLAVGVKLREMKAQLEAERKELNHVKDERNEYAKVNTENRDARCKAEIALVAAQQEITNLKAKLYDMMIAGAQVTAA